MFKYAIEIREETHALCTFLNDGITPDLQTPPSVLFVEINGPREITTKVMRSTEPLPENTLIFKP